MRRTGVLIATAAIALMAAGCAGEEDRAPAEPVEAGPERADSVFDPEVGTGPVDPAASEAELRKDTAADATPVRLGERFAWCLTVQAMWDDQDLYRAEAEVAAGAHRTALDIYEAATDDLDRAEAHEAVEQALGEYRFVASVYGRVRWRSAGLIVGDESSLQAGDWEDATLQVARERAVEAFRAGAAADTLAAIDLAYEATETAAHLSAAALSDVDESDQPVEAPDSGASLFEASEGWLVATEALQDAVEAAEEAEDARKAASAAVKAARAAVGDAEGSAIAIYEAAHADGNWVAMITDVEVHMTTARSAAEDAGDFSEQAFEAQVAAQVAAEAARAAAQDSATARALAEQIGATKGKQAYWDMPIRARWARIDAEREASRAARIAGSPTRTAADAAQAIEEAAWHAARIVAAVDVQAVSAFRQSLQESCR